jgi:hypothetical protein
MPELYGDGRTDVSSSFEKARIRRLLAARFMRLRQERESPPPLKDDGKRTPLARQARARQRRRRRRYLGKTAW